MPLFEEAGKFLAGRVMTDADTLMQIELDSASAWQPNLSQRAVREAAAG
jgi:hypothetical protein